MPFHVISLKESYYLLTVSKSYAILIYQYLSLPILRIDPDYVKAYALISISLHSVFDVIPKPTSFSACY